MKFSSLLCVFVLIAVGAQTLFANELPLSVEANSGEAFQCTHLKVNLSINGPLCLCTESMKFRNVLDRRSNATFVCPLPFGAGALLFKRTGGTIGQQKKVWNTFVADLPDVGPREEIELELSYGFVASRDKVGEREFRVSLRGLAKIDHFDLQVKCHPLPGRHVQAGEAWYGLTRRENKGTVTLSLKGVDDFVPLYDFVMRTTPAGDEPSCVLQAPPTNSFLSFRPDVPALSQRIHKSAGWFIAVDTSASRSVTGRDQFRLIRGILSRLGRLEEGRPFRLFVFDNNVEELVHWRSGQGDIYETLLPFLSRQPLGATDLSKVLHELTDIATKLRRPHRFVIFTDGSSTLGRRPDTALLDFSALWPEQHRLDVVVLGTFEVDGITEKLARLGGGRVVRLHELVRARGELEEVVEALRQPVGAMVRIEKSPEGPALSPEDLLQSQFADVTPGRELFTVGVPSLTGQKPKELLYRVNDGEVQRLAITLAQALPQPMRLMRQSPVSVTLSRKSGRHIDESFAQFALKGAKKQLESEVKEFMELDERLRRDPSLLSAFNNVRQAVAQLRKEETLTVIEHLWTSLIDLKRAMVPRLLAMQRVKQKLQRGSLSAPNVLMDGMRQTLKDNPSDRVTREALCHSLAKEGLFEDLCREATLWLRMEPRQPVAYEFYGLACFELGRYKEALRAAASLAEIAWGGHDGVDNELLEQSTLMALRWNGFEEAKAIYTFTRF